MTIRDRTSRKLIITVELDAEEFFSMCAGREASGNAVVINDFDNYGKVVEVNRTVIWSDKLKNWQCSKADLNAIIDENRPIYDIDGWCMQHVGEVLSQGQHNSQAGTLSVVTKRYVEPTKEEE